MDNFINWYTNHEDEIKTNQDVTLQATLDEKSLNATNNVKLKQVGALSPNTSSLPFYLNEKTSWFKLPSDLSVLNHMRPLDYLKTYMTGAKFRTAYLNILFSKHKSDDLIKSQKEVISKEACWSAIRELSQYRLNECDLNELVEFLDLSSSSRFERDDFVCIVLFSEVYFFKKFYSNCVMSSTSCIERLDFNYVFTKLDTKLMNREMYRVLKVVNDFHLNF